MMESGHFLPYSSLKLKSKSDFFDVAVSKVELGEEQRQMLQFQRTEQESRIRSNYSINGTGGRRISDVSSWRWVLEDLSKRLTECIDALKHEHNALRVVVKRVQDEIDYHSREGTRPGAICPLTDNVEEAIKQELEFLRDQKKNFERLIKELDKQTKAIQKTKNRIETDVMNKAQTIKIDEICASKEYKNATVKEYSRKKGSPMTRWVKRCAALKRAGLKALCNGVITRQQIRGARVQLSIQAQSYSTRVDAALRRRLHANKIKIEDLKWQREEAVRDYTSLEEELALAERTLIDTLDNERIAEARFENRTQRPARELIKDDVNKNLRGEQAKLKKLSKELRNNIKRIITLQNNLSEAISHIDCYAEDISQVISLDEERIQNRQGEVVTSDSATIAVVRPPVAEACDFNNQLTAIREEDEDDYPFDY